MPNLVLWINRLRLAFRRPAIGKAFQIFPCRGLKLTAFPRKQLSESTLSVATKVIQEGVRRSKLRAIQSVGPLCCCIIAASVSVSTVARADDVSAWGKTVNVVRIVSDPGINTQRFYGTIVQKVGQPLEQAKVNQSLKDLYATGLFRNLQADIEEEMGGVVLIFRGHATYFVGLVGVSGAPKAINGNVLASASRLRLGQPVTQEDLNTASDRLKNILLQNGFYQAQVKTELEKLSDQEANILFVVDPGDPATLVAVDYHGNFLLPAVRLDQIASWRPGMHLTAARAERGLARFRRYYVKHGRPEANASIEARTPDPAHNTERLAVQVEAGPVVHVSVRGASIRRYHLKRLIPVYTEGQTDELSLAQGGRNLEDYFQQEGYFSASVSWKREMSHDGQRLNITYSVKLGPRGNLAGIAFEGNNHIPDTDIRPLLQIRTAEFPRVRGVFSRDLLARAVKSITDLYQSKGYLEAAVVPRLNDHYRDEPNQLFVIFDIREGVQTKVARLTIRGVDEATQAALRSFLLSDPGQPYSPQRATTDQGAILTYLGNRGLNHAEVNWKASPSSVDHQMDAQFDIRPGLQEKLQRIVIMGNEHTHTGVINRELRMKVGQPLRQSDMLESQRRLYDLGLFNQVQIAHQDPDVGGPDRTLLVSVEEAKRWTVGYGGGIDVQRLETNEPQGQYKASPRLGLELTRTNVGGRPQTFSIRGRYSDLEKQGAGSYVIPHFLNRDTLDLRISALTEQTRDVLTFSSRREEASVIFEKRPSPSTLMLLRYTQRRVAVDEATLRINPADIPLASQPVRVALIEGTYVNDHRDNVADATRGSYSLLDAGVSSQNLGSQSNFMRGSGQNSTYYMINSHLIFARDTRLGLESPLGGLIRVKLPDGTTVLTHDIPLPERFFMGGSESHRGFSINQAGPRDPVTGYPVGGNALFLNSLELRLRFNQNRYGLVLFHDAGNVYSSIRLMRLLKFSQSSPTDFDYTVHAVGVGLRYQTPVGPLRFDVGYALNPPRFQVQTSNAPPEVNRLPSIQFLLSVGQSF
jgi:outer membrane protein assembly complex protein YaeT